MSNKGAILRMVFGVVALIVGIGLFLTVVTGFYNVIDAATSVEDAEDDVTTGALETEADVTLSLALLNDDVDNVESVTSNDTDDTPVADSYADLVLTVSGLDSDTVRTLTVTYDHGIISYFTAMETIAAIGPAVLFIALVFGSGALVVSGARGYRKK